MARVLSRSPLRSYDFEQLRTGLHGLIALGIIYTC